MANYKEVFEGAADLLKRFSGTAAKVAIKNGEHFSSKAAKDAAKLLRAQLKKGEIKNVTFLKGKKVGFGSMSRASTKYEQKEYIRQYKQFRYTKRVLNNKWGQKNFHIDKNTGKLIDNHTHKPISAHDAFAKMRANTNARSGHFPEQDVKSGYSSWEKAHKPNFDPFKDSLKAEKEAEKAAKEASKKAGKGAEKAANATKEEKIVNGKPEDVHPKAESQAPKNSAGGGGDNKIPPEKQQEHWYRNNFGKAAGMAWKNFLDFGMKHPAWAVLTPILGYNYLAAQHNGRSMITQLQGAAFGWDKDEDGTVLGAKGAFPIITQLLGGTRAKENGWLGEGVDDTLGEGTYEKLNGYGDELAGGIENLAHRGGKMMDTMSKYSHNVLDETGNLYNSAKDSITYGNHKDGETVDELSNGDGYSGMAQNPASVKRQNLDAAAMAGGAAMTFLGGGLPLKALGLLTSAIGVNDYRKNSQGRQMQQQQQVVTYNQPSNGYSVSL